MRTQSASAAALSAASNLASMTRSATRGSATLYQANRPERRTLHLAGVLIGSGDGTVHGPKLTGTLEWTLFEQPGSTMCPLAPVGRITTGDGARIRFQGRGYATRPRQSDPTWRVAATLYFTISDSRYSWLDGALALWEGEFNEITHQARYTAFS
jgi:hypothetical protein